MPGIRFSLSYNKFDAEATAADMQAQLNECFVKAARAYLKAAIPLIPVLTGFARSVLSPIEDLVGQYKLVGGKRATFDSRRGGSTRVKKMTPRTYYYYHPGGPRVVRTNIGGRQFSKAWITQYQPAASRSVKGYTKKVGGRGGRHTMYFRFENTVEYFDNPKSNTAWGASKAGEQAFATTFKTEFAKIKPRLKKTRVNVKT